MLIRKCGDQNATPLVVHALSQLKDGGTLIFEPGEYHFYEDGALCRYLTPSNNSSGQKSIVFPLIDCRDVTVDGYGSTFVFHDLAFPFAVKDSRNITVKNFTVTTRFPSFVIAEVRDIDENGFSLYTDRGSAPCRTENGNLIFDLEHRSVSTQNQKLSLHQLSTLGVHYLFAGDCAESKENLATTFTDTDAKAFDGGIRFTYRTTPNSMPCRYASGERIAVNLEEHRERDVFFFDNAEDITVQNITVHRGGGMGIIAQMCRNITVDGFHAEPLDNEPVSLTADVFHFIQCDGELVIENSTLNSSLDDACNIHGTYMTLQSGNGHEITARYGHTDQDHLLVCRPGDVLDLIDAETLRVVGHATVKSAAFTDRSGLNIGLTVKEDISSIAHPGMLIENPHRMPNITLRGNNWYNFPHIRLSGAGKILVENNTFHECSCAVMAYDLSQYWYESGRIRDLCIRHNKIGPCRYACINTGVSGYENGNTPLIHETIRIEQNDFITNGGKVLNVFGFNRVIVRENTENGKPFYAL